MAARCCLCLVVTLLLATSPVVAEGDFPPLLSPAVAPGSPTPMVQTLEPFWVRAEYLMWRFKPTEIHVPLATTGDFARPTGGLLGDPSTLVLFGAESISYDWLTGGRLTVGMNLTNDGTFGVEVIGFGIERGAYSIGITSDTAGNTPLFLIFNSTVPFFGTAGESGGIFAGPVAQGGPGPGGMAFGSHSLLWGVEANAVGLFWQQGAACVHLLAGLRYLDLDETFQIDAQTFLTGFGIHDHFRTHNQYLGFQSGIRGGYTFCEDWTIEATGKISVGDNRQTLDISGESYRPTGTVPGGFYAVSSNIGKTHRDALSVVPEVGLRLSYHPLEHCRIFLGYDFLYFTNVIRASEEINRNINGTLQPNAFLAALPGNNPTRFFGDTNFWTHGLNVGFEYRF